MEIVSYDPKWKKDFIALNTEWILKYFDRLEDHDLESFENIDRQIEQGGMIYFALEEDEVLACCMTVPLEGDTWEICKLGSSSSRSHPGAGSRVFKACMDWAQGKGAGRLFIISNRKLKPALHIYDKFGFQEVILDDYGYDRGDIALEYCF